MAIDITKCEYGVLNLPQPALTAASKGRDPRTGRFVKGSTPANKGKRWSEFMSKRGQRRASKGWRNLIEHRCERPANAGRPKVPVIGIRISDGRWWRFPSLTVAEEKTGVRQENIRQCALHIRSNKKSKAVRKSAGGFRWFLESDDEWMRQVMKDGL